MPRTQGDKLQFQLEAFRFQQSDSGLVCDKLCNTLYDATMVYKQLSFAGLHHMHVEGGCSNSSSKS